MLPKLVMFIILTPGIGLILVHMYLGCIESVILLWDNVYAFIIGIQKTSENFLYHGLKEMWKDVCVLKAITKLMILWMITHLGNEMLAPVCFKGIIVIDN